MTDDIRPLGHLSDLAGTLTPDGHQLMVRVYFEDTDFSGVVYHARYLHFFERGRSDFLRLKGVHHKELRDGLYGEPLFFVVKAMALDFHAAAHIDDVLSVETMIEGQKGARILMKQHILRDGARIASASLSVVLVNDSGKPRRLPKTVGQALRLKT